MADTQDRSGVFVATALLGLPSSAAKRRQHIAAGVSPQIPEASRLKTAKRLARFDRRSIAFALAFVLLCGFVQPVCSQAPAPQPAESGPEKVNPRTVVEAYFNAIKNGDFDAANAVVNIELKRKHFEETRRYYDSQKPAVSTVFQSQTGHRACVVTDRFRLKMNDAPLQPEGPFVVELDDTSGRWLIQMILHTGNETAAKSIVEFKRKYTDAIEIAPPKPATRTKPNRKLTIFHIEHADVTTIAGILDELFDEFSIVVDHRTGTILVRYDEDSEIDALEAVLKVLDSEKQLPKREPVASAQPGSAQGIPGTPAVSGFPAAVSAAPDVEKLRTRFAEFNQRAAFTALKTLEFEEKVGEAEEAAKLRATLRQHVEKAFQARQDLQRAELAQLKQRFSRIERQIESREKIGDRIIERRVEELLDPELQWESPQGSPTAGGASSGDTNPLSRNLGGPAGVIQSETPEALVQSGGGSSTGTPIAGGKQMKIQFRITQPAEMRIHWDGGKQTIVVPGRAEASTGDKIGFSLTNIEGREGLQLYGSVEVPPLKQTETFLKHNAVPLEFTDEDFDQVTAGNLVTKVLLLPNSEHQEIAIAGIETLVTTRLDPGVDPLAEARRRGAILAILRLGNRIPAGNSNGKVTSLNSKFENESQLIEATALLFFYSEQCAICKKVEPDFNKAVSELGLPTLHIDGLKHPEIAKRFRVTATPTFVLLYCGEERERVTGTEFQPLVEKLNVYWEDSHGRERRHLSLGEGGLKAFLTRELAEAQRARESVLTDVIAQELVVAELGPPVELRPDLTKEQREQIEKENKHRQREQERVAGLKVEMKPYDAKIELIRMRLKEVESRSGRSGKPNAGKSVVWIEVILAAELNKTARTNAAYINGTIVSADGHIAVVFGPGATTTTLRKLLRKVTVSLSDGTSHQARLLTCDAQTGAALLKIEATGLPFLKPLKDPVPVSRRLTVHAMWGANEPARLPVVVVASPFRFQDHDGFFAVTETNQASVIAEYAGAPLLTSSGQLQGILCANEGQLLYGPPAIQSEDPKPRRAAAVPASVIAKLLDKAEKLPVSESMEAP